MLINKITRITFSNIRNFESYSQVVDKSVIFVGCNGMGKTSILEAISLLCGRGIRSAKYQEILNYNFPLNTTWTTLIELHDGDYSNQISAEYKNGKKTIKINGKQVKNFNEILNYIKIIWITQSDYHQLLISNSYRRNFLDRMAAQLIPNYQNYLSGYKYYSTERHKILLSNYDDIWIREIEKNLAKLNILIMKIRDDMVDKLNSVIRSKSKFSPMIRITGLLEQKNLSENEIIKFLEQNRPLHTQMKRSNIGIHLSKVDILNAFDNRNIEQLSSGEQRLLLNQLIINFVHIQNENDKNKIIMLLDDILTFFDEQNQNLLMKNLLDLDVQFFITTNSFKLTSDILDMVQVIDKF